MATLRPRDVGEDRDAVIEQQGDVDITRELLLLLEVQDRGHFFAVASILMRRILLNYARDRRAQKRRGRLRSVPIDEERLLIPDAHAERLMELDQLLRLMDCDHPRQATAVAHRYFGGLRNGEIAELAGVSLATVERDLRFGRAWLARRWQSDGVAVVA